jgi:antitoxin ParD1/3/4
MVFNHTLRFDCRPAIAVPTRIRRPDVSVSSREPAFAGVSRPDVCQLNKYRSPDPFVYLTIHPLGNSCQFGDNAPMPTKNVNLSERQDRFIRQSVKGGQYRNASEVVRAGLRMLEHEQQEDRLKLARLRRLAADAFSALDRGEHVTVAVEELDEFLGAVGRETRSSGRK